MVVTPKEAIKFRSAEDRRVAAQLEREIDKHLKENYDGEPEYLHIDYPNDRVFKELKSRYNAAGWNIRLESDQREGDYLVFSEVRR
jgi:hypothetical protein